MELEGRIDKDEAVTRVPERWYRVTLRLALHRESRRRFGLLPSLPVPGHGRRLTLHRFFVEREKNKKRRNKTRQDVIELVRRSLTAVVFKKKKKKKSGNWFEICA